MLKGGTVPLGLGFLSSKPRPNFLDHALLPTPSCLGYATACDVASLVRIKKQNLKEK